MFGSRFSNVRKNLSVAFNALYAIFASVFMLLCCRMSNFKDDRNMILLFYCIFWFYCFLESTSIES